MAKIHNAFGKGEIQSGVWTPKSNFVFCTQCLNCRFFGDGDTHYKYQCKTAFGEKVADNTSVAYSYSFWEGRDLAEYQKATRNMQIPDKCPKYMPTKGGGSAPSSSSSGSSGGGGGFGGGFMDALKTDLNTGSRIMDEAGLGLVGDVGKLAVKGIGAAIQASKANKAAEEAERAQHLAEDRQKAEDYMNTIRFCNVSGDVKDTEQALKTLLKILTWESYLDSDEEKALKAPAEEKYNEGIAHLREIGEEKKAASYESKLKHTFYALNKKIDDKMNAVGDAMAAKMEAGVDAMTAKMEATGAAVGAKVADLTAPAREKMNAAKDAAADKAKELAAAGADKAKELAAAGAAKALSGLKGLFGKKKG